MKLVIKIVFLFFFSFAFISGALLYIITHHTIDFSILAQSHNARASILLDDQGNEWARFAIDRREPIAYNDIPVHLINAFIAAEDWQFFHHYGISPKAIFRSLLVNLISGKKRQGASTITQQLVKLLFFDSQKTFKRKLKEQCYAILAELQFTKEQILEAYLNNVYFGFGIYGVEAASQRFWAKSVNQLSIDECAVLAAIIRSPRHYCPLLAADVCKRRRDLILSSMKKLHFINQEEFETAIAKPISILESQHSSVAPHLKELIRIKLEEMVGKQKLYSGGLIIQTTINKKLQLSAQKSFANHLKTYKTDIVADIDGALISLDSQTGQIKSMIGGYDFNTSKYNRAWQAKRQIGSVIKPLIFANAIAKGARMNDCYIDEPIKITQANSVWQPNNYDDKFQGTMTLAYSLLRSNNIIAIKTLLEFGIDPVVSLIKSCGIKETIHPYPSLALGCIDVSALQVAGMFNIFANGGMYVEPYFIQWIKDEWGQRIYKHTPKKQKILDPIVNAQVSKVLEQGLKRWAKTYEFNLENGPAISKTGTTNDCRTCWFAASTPELTTVVYIGCDDNRSMGLIYPIKTAFPIWFDIYKECSSAKDFAYPSTLKSYFINQWTGYQTRETDTQAIEILV